MMAINDRRAGQIVTNLTSRLNRCGVISPRLGVQFSNLKKMAEQSAPIICLLSLTNDLGWHHRPGEARQKHTGDKTLGFFF